MTRPTAQSARISSSSVSALEATTLASGLGAAGLWMGLLATQWDRLTAIGVICSESVGLLGHCALCYPAAALTVLTAVLAAASLRRSPST